MARSKACCCMRCCLQIMEEYVQGYCQKPRVLWEADISSFSETGSFLCLCLCLLLTKSTRYYTLFLINDLRFVLECDVLLFDYFRRSSSLRQMLWYDDKAKPHLLSFQPGSRDGAIQCFIKRDKSNLTYHLFLCLSPGE